MRGDEAAVAGRVTGKWRVDCFRCGKLHLKESSILRCAQSLTNAVMGNVQVKISLPNFSMNGYLAAKKGMADEYLELQILIAEQRERPTDFCLSSQGFARAENEPEAVKLILDELISFASVRRDAHAELLTKIDALTAKMLAAPFVPVTTTKPGKKDWRVNIVMNNVDIESNTIIEYYFKFAPVRLNKYEENGPLQNGKLSYGADIKVAKPDEDKFVFEYGGKFFGLKPVGDSMRFWELPEKVTLERVLDTSMPVRL